MPWSDIAKHTDVDDALDAWMSCFVGVCDTHAPVKRRNVKRNSQTGSQETSLLPCKRETGTSRKGGGITIKCGETR